MRSAGRRAYRAGAALRGRGSNELSELLEVGAHGVTAILATWLGLLVLTRAGRAHGAPVFSFLCLLLVTWSLAIIAQRLGTEPSVHGPLNLLEDASAFLLPPVTTHLAIAVALEGGRSRFATTVLAAGYTIAALAILQAAVDPANAIGFAEGSWSPMGIPGPVIGWGFALIVPPSGWSASATSWRDCAVRAPMMRGGGSSRSASRPWCWASSGA